MAVILKFPKEARALDETSAVQGAQSAQILFFTGVRYERVTAAAPRRQRRARRQRNPHGVKSA